ncbi:uracil-DNA glycosylase [Brevundimonas sp. S30B]|jgi:uracil-DNA glycosylase|uniref:uracil-DNA glycosylase n=1 Tax=unclassified Brevundimonas TaxID=2622653 RepID=UPI001072A473|nr:MULTISPECIES: uracil-DNA glycosylase [unclassified Brevundimonas]QBX37841.1 uracil-DNA glycosylase [Brevundimonas sp. MF30-B]TFW02803.1 uracil-DNA glycosylase [Brevundimonas sp. S30B]
MTPSEFVCALQAATLPSVFNPWRDQCAACDLEDAPALRRENLRLFLERALETRVTTMWIARDLGYRGGRRTGVPLTDEVHLSEASALLGDIGLVRATDGPIVAERTAAVIWRVLAQVRQPVVLWNVFPFHPHLADDPMSNRCHTRAERDETWPLLEALIAMVRPEKIVAIGRDASAALAELGVPASAVRHPSYGGQAEFMAGMYDLYEVTRDEPPLFGRLEPVAVRH